MLVLVSFVADLSGEEIPRGTEFVVRVMDDVDVERDRKGKKYRAELAEDLEVDGRVAARRGDDVVLRLEQASQKNDGWGGFKGSKLKLSAVEMRLDGRMKKIETEDLVRTGDSRKKRMLTGGLIGAAAGAIIGATAGGGQGAGIGAGAGAAAGTAVGAAVGGENVRIKSESKLTFTLKDPVRW